MSATRYLMDTHAVIFWRNQVEVSQAFIDFFDEQAQQGNLFVSSIVFWEIGLLAQKGRIAISDVQAWKDELLNNANIQLIDPTANEMIASTQLPQHHKDPFDRLLIAQAQQRNMHLVTRDRSIAMYQVMTHWIA